MFRMPSLCLYLSMFLSFASLRFRTCEYSPICLVIFVLLCVGGGFSGILLYSYNLYSKVSFFGSRLLQHMFVCIYFYVSVLFIHRIIQ
jgi:hypothetical protein